jgi:hypothetical protein
MLRHFTGILVLAAVAAWAIFYLPYTPTWAVLQMKRAVDARDGQEAARYIDFDSVVRHAGQEMVQKRGGGDPLSTVLGNAAIDLFIKPLSQLVQSWAVKKVDDGAKEVQMPGAAVVGSLVLMHRNGDTAYTDFKDRKGQEWEIHLAREDDRWKLVEVKNVEQLLEKLQHDAQSGLPPGSSPPPPSPPAP